MNTAKEIKVIPMVKGILLSFAKEREKRLLVPSFPLVLGSFFFLKVFDLLVSEAILLFRVYLKFGNGFRNILIYFYCLDKYSANPFLIFLTIEGPS